MGHVHDVNDVSVQVCWNFADFPRGSGAIFAFGKVSAPRDVRGARSGSADVSFRLNGPCYAHVYNCQSVYIQPNARLVRDGSTFSTFSQAYKPYVRGGGVYVQRTLFKITENVYV